jgi:hypothetical protein
MRDALVCAECGGIEVCDEDCKAALRARAAFTRQQVRAAERAVIEAARAWAKTAGNGPHRNQQELALYEAVQALVERADD